MKAYKIGDLVEVKCGITTPMQKGSVGLVTEVRVKVTGMPHYIIRFSERETFLYYHDELNEV